VNGIYKYVIEICTQYLTTLKVNDKKEDCFSTLDYRIILWVITFNRIVKANGFRSIFLYNKGKSPKRGNNSAKNF